MTERLEVGGFPCNQLAYQLAGVSSEGSVDVGNEWSADPPCGSTYGTVLSILQPPHDVEQVVP